MSDPKIHNEDELLLQLTTGNVTAFNTLYKRYYEAVFANIIKITRDEIAAEDILQEVFLAMWNRRLQFAGQQKIAGWLFVTSYNKSLNYLRRILRERVRMGKLPVNTDTEESETALAETHLQLIEEAIDRLPTQRKKVFLLCRFEGKTYEETANLLNISKNTVKDHLAHASEFIKQYIQQHPDYPFTAGIIIFISTAI